MGVQPYHGPKEGTMGYSLDGGHNWKPFSFGGAAAAGGRRGGGGGGGPLTLFHSTRICANDGNDPEKHGVSKPICVGPTPPRPCAGSRRTEPPLCRPSPSRPPRKPAVCAEGRTAARSGKSARPASAPARASGRSARAPLPDRSRPSVAVHPRQPLPGEVPAGRVQRPHDGFQMPIQSQGKPGVLRVGYVATAPHFRCIAALDSYSQQATKHVRFLYVFARRQFPRNEPEVRVARFDRLMEVSAGRVHGPSSRNWSLLTTFSPVPSSSFEPPPVSCVAPVERPSVCTAEPVPRLAGSSVCRSHRK